MTLRDKIKNNNILRPFVNIAKEIRNNFPKQSYSQTGEDLIIKHLLESLKIKKIFYIDIGAHHPKYLSNTYLFYKQGSSGICIEPDPKLYKRIKYIRRRDVCLNVGISDQTNENLNFFVMEIPTLNTFSKSEAQKMELEKLCGIKKIISVPVMSINDLFLKYNRKVDLLTIDTEGFDEKILASVDFSKYRPFIICVESVIYQGCGIDNKGDNLNKILTNNGYKLYADTHINSIYIDTRLNAIS
jgi:FkbM family methyltransferase